MDELDGISNNLTSALAKLDEKKELAVQNINSAFSTVHAALDAKNVELIAEVEKKVDKQSIVIAQELSMIRGSSIDAKEVVENLKTQLNQGSAIQSFIAASKCQKWLDKKVAASYPVNSVSVPELDMSHVQSEIDHIGLGSAPEYKDAVNDVQAYLMGYFGRFLGSSNGKVVQVDGKSRQYWTIVHCGNGCVGLMDNRGMYLSAQSRERVTLSKSLGMNEQFQLVPNGDITNVYSPAQDGYLRAYEDTNAIDLASGAQAWEQWSILMKAGQL